jgi:hypothetical protein
MDTKKITELSYDLASLQTAHFYCPNWAFVGFRTELRSVLKECVIRPQYDCYSGGSAKELCEELNEAIKPVIERWVLKKNGQLKGTLKEM